MKKSLMVMALMGASSAFSADVVYSEKPDTEPIAVAAGDTASILGQSALGRHLKLYLKFDDEAGLLVNAAPNPDPEYAVKFGKGSSNSFLFDQTPVFSGSKKNVGITNECYRGAGAVDFVNGNTCYIKPVPRAAWGDRPFTYCCWMRMDPDAYDMKDDGTVRSETNHGIFGVLNATNASTHVGVRFGLAGKKGSDGGTGDLFKLITFGRSDGAASKTVGDLREKGWYHVALVYNPDSNWQYTAYTNGAYLAASNKGRFVAGDLSGDDLDVMLVGSTRYNQYLRTTSNELLFDEAMFFDRVLSADEIGWVMEHTRPEEKTFAAAWDVAQDGRLELTGTNVETAVTGAGVLDTVGSLTLTPLESAFFNGGFCGAGELRLAPAATKTYFVAATNAMANGKIAVDSGTVMMFSPGAAELREKFGDNLRAFWNFDGLGEGGWTFDWSGNGNALKEARQKWATGPSYVANTDTAVAGSGIEHLWGPSIGMADDPTVKNTADNYLYPVKAISGFTSGADNSYTFSIWAKTATDVGGRSGFFRIDGGSHGTRFLDNLTSANPSAYFGSKSDGYLTVSIALHEGESALPGGDWHHFVLTYDSTLSRKADDPSVDPTLDANKHYRAYVDGQLVVAQAGTNTATKINNFGTSNKLWLGIGLENGQNRSWHGWLDECVVLNRVATAEEVQFLYGHRQATPTVATGILPADGELEVASGATAAFDLANETVAKLSGAGAVELSATAKLSVTDAVAFTGSFSGAGKLALGENLKWATPVDGKGRALAGKYTYFTVPTSMLYEYSSANWTTVAPTFRGAFVKVFTRDNGDDTVTFMATVKNPGLTVIFR